MSIHPAPQTYTVQDYLAWAGDWELVYGHPMAMSPSPVFDLSKCSIDFDFSRLWKRKG